MYRLRELERDDISMLNKWRNDYELIDLLGAPFRYINSEVDDVWYDNYMNSRANTVRCAILNDDDCFIGVVSLTDINYINQSAKFHIMIGEKGARKCGAGTYATNKMLAHGFYNLNLQRIELEVLSRNESAIHLYEKVGFVREGKKRNAVFKKGRFEDMYYYSVLRNEWCAS